MLKIDTVTETETDALIRLTGRVEAEQLPELKTLLARASKAGRKVTLDLEGVSAVDRDTVRFFVSGPGRSAHLLHCPAYVKEWCRAETRRKGPRLVKTAGAVIFGLVLASATARGETVRLSLRDAVSRALSEGTASRLAAERTARSRVTAEQARSGLLPQIDAEVQDANEILNLKTFGFTLPGLPATVGPFNVFDAHVRVAARLIDVAAYRRWRAARQGIVVSDLERRTTENEVAAAVATLYVGVQRAEASIEASRANVELSSKLFTLADDQRKAGVATRIDSTRAAVALSRQRQLLLLAETRANAARLALVRAIGLDFASDLVLTDPLREESDALPTVEQAILEARRQRPELREASERMRQAELALSADRAEKLPSVGAQFQGGYNGNHLRDLDWNRTYGATLSIPIFTGGRLASRIAENESRLREVQIRERDTERQVEEDIRQALLNFTGARSRAAVADESEKLARQELEFAQDRFSNGITSSIEVDNAQTSLTAALDDRIAALADEAQARYDLARATGAIRDYITPSAAVSAP
ncbi:MAG: TolC family protein [Acidobacteriota bacterium]|nr:TolC family protein [Acidobacteriota bacterium]